MYVSDMLSRAYLPGHDKTQLPQCHIFQLEQEDQLFRDIESMDQLKHMSLSTATHHQIKSATTADVTLQCLATTVLTGWAETKEETPIEIREYWTFRDEITVQGGVIYKGTKIVIPKLLRNLMIKKAHSCHGGMEASVRKARDTLFWPGMAAEIKDHVMACDICAEYSSKQAKEPMMSHTIPSRPWAKVGQDLFTLHNKSYLVTVDFYSDYFELDELEDTTATTVINATKRHFARHGIADMVTDNGPQYTSQEFQEFKNTWQFEHITSSPYHSQANGKSESAVKIAKNILKKAKNTDIQMALLEWRNTPDANGNSPMQKLQSRRTKTTLPTAEILFQPKVVENVLDNIAARRKKAKAHYDQTAKPLPELEVGQRIRIQSDPRGKTWTETGECVAKVAPRSYVVHTDSGKTLRRNRKFIQEDKTNGSQPAPVEIITEPTQVQTPVKSQTPVKPAMDANPNVTMTTSRSGRVVRPVARLDL